MLTSVKNEKKGMEGYVYVSYGHPKYLKHTIASIITLRRYDKKRPVALICSDKQRKIIEEQNLTELFDVLHPLPEEHSSIVGFKHNVDKYMLFEKNLFLDSDIVWCKNPDPLWKSFSIFDFTITGNLISDSFFGATKGVGVLFDVVFRRRKRTLNRFGLTYLSRVQSGMIYASDHELTKKVCELAGEMLDRKDETHFRSRKMEQGRTMESCEWSLAMAMSKLNVPVFPWLQGHESPQLDYISELTEHDDDFHYVRCKYYSHDFVFSFRGLKSNWFRSSLYKFFSLFTGMGDYLYVTPYCIHFGWYHQKVPFNSFSEVVWKKITDNPLSIQSVREYVNIVNQ
ncbi:MAG: hypothetical protein ACPGGA_03690 [Balneolaceae bacterium]